VECEKKGMLISQQILMQLSTIMDGKVEDIEYTIHRMIALFLVDIAKEETTMEGFREMAQATADNAVAFIQTNLPEMGEEAPVRAVH
jgi:hypothetical protein